MIEADRLPNKGRTTSIIDPSQQIFTDAGNMSALDMHGNFMTQTTFINGLSGPDDGGRPARRPNTGRPKGKALPIEKHQMRYLKDAGRYAGAPDKPEELDKWLQTLHSA